MFFVNFSLFVLSFTKKKFNFVREMRKCRTSMGVYHHLCGMEAGLGHNLILLTF